MYKRKLDIFLVFLYTYYGDIMKYLVISDIHGMLEYAKKIDVIVKREQPDNIILLGDLYDDYSGRSNVEVSYILNKYKDIILCTRGNCDNSFDESISDFIFKDYIELTLNNRVFFFTHGHLYRTIPNYVEIYVYGHLHTCFIKKENDKIIVNVGSISKPRQGTNNSYLIIDDKNIILKNIDGMLIDKVRYNLN